MKYLVHRETKEHCVYEGGEFGIYWRLVEADADGWVPWNGGECPLPDWCECEIQTREGDRLLSREAKRWTWAPNIGDATITHYRPILAEKEELPQSIKSAAEQISRLQDAAFEQWLEERADAVINAEKTVFDRLKSAIAAAESIPAIIAEIDALLPDGYCVAKREEQPAEDMSDWRNWREGDLVTAHGLRGGYLENDFPENVPHKIVAKCLSGLDVQSSNRSVLYFDGREISRGELKFHSRPSKVTE